MRSRKALQYADSIDDVVATMRTATTAAMRTTGSLATAKRAKSPILSSV